MYMDDMKLFEKMKRTGISDTRSYVVIETERSIT